MSFSVLNPTIYFKEKIASARDVQAATEVLDELLSGGYGVWTDGSIYYIRQLVARVNGLKIEVYSRDHAPPHFHIIGGDIDATFSIIDCEHLEGHIGGRECALVKWWHQGSRAKLIKAWNESRPTNCPIGPILD